MLGENNEGAKIVVGKFENSLTGENEEVADAQGNTLSIISGSIAQGNQDDAHWACRGWVALRQAESEMRDARGETKKLRKSPSSHSLSSVVGATILASDMGGV